MKKNIKSLMSFIMPSVAGLCISFVSVAQESNGAPDIEETLFCGDAAGFASQFIELGDHIGRNLDQVVGADNSYQCKVKLSVTQEGTITSFEAVECANTEIMSKVVSIASPLPVNQDHCLVSAINKVVWNIKS